ncbi:RNA-binding protein [Candidatus Binatia bacterium]|nr:RNA-binding protein [Candidatus Binatia bacterium]
MSRKLYVGNLAGEIDDASLRKIFAEHGAVDSAEVIKDRITSQSKGFGFVEMSSNGEAQAAMSALHGSEQGGRPIKVSEAKPRESRGGSFGGGRRF